MIDRGHLIDKTQSIVDESVDGDVAIVPFPELLHRANVPKHFAVLTFDIECAATDYAKFVEAIITEGWRPEYLILELKENQLAKEAVEKLGFQYLKTMRYDDIFSRLS